MIFNATAEDNVNAFPLPPEEEDTNDNDHSDGGPGRDPGSHDHGTRARGRMQQAASEELLKRKERINVRNSECLRDYSTSRF